MKIFCNIVLCTVNQRQCPLVEPNDRSWFWFENQIQRMESSNIFRGLKVHSVRLELWHHNWLLYLFLLSLIVQPNQIITLNASTRIKTCDLELTHLLLDQSSSMTNLSNAGTPTTGSNQQQRANAIDSESGRAVDNQYSFVWMYKRYAC